MYKCITESDDNILMLLTQSVAIYLHKILTLTQSYDYIKTVKLFSLLSCLFFHMDEHIHAHVPSKVVLVCVVTAFAIKSNIREKYSSSTLLFSNLSFRSSSTRM